MKTTLQEAKKNAEILLENRKIYSSDKAFECCSPVYCSTNENFSGYVPKDYNLSNLDVLSVTGSGDIPIEFALRKATNVTCFDINALAEYMAQLKIVSVLTLDHNDFLDFYSDFSIMGNCEKSFNSDVYANKIEKYLKKDSREFWNHIYTIASNKKSLFPPGVLIRSSNLFANNSVSYEILRNIDSFVEKNNYYKLKRILEKVKFSFIESSLLDLPQSIGNNKYSIIYLSNIAEYLKDMYENDRLSKFKDFLINYLNHNLDENGLMIGAYLFDFLNNEEKDDYDIYDPNKREQFLTDIFSMTTFPSATYDLHRTKDAVLILTKNNNIKRIDKYVKKWHLIIRATCGSFLCYNINEVINMEKVSIDTFYLKNATKLDIDTIFKYKLDTITNGNNIDKEELRKIENYIRYNINIHLSDYKIIMISKKEIGIFCSYLTDNDNYLLDEIYLISDYRKLGIGGKIIGNLLNKVCYEQKKVYLWVYKLNEKAIQFYKNKGFKIIDETLTRYKMSFE